MAEQFPDDLRYTESDEWVRLDGDEAVVGITSFASEQLGDVVYVQLPDAGAEIRRDAGFGEIESVKAVSDLISPLSGQVIESNSELEDNPGVVNDDPYGQGWLIRLRPSDSTEFENLLDASAYAASTAERA
jgi:glycine cleavage system H protein